MRCFSSEQTSQSIENDVVNVVCTGRIFSQKSQKADFKSLMSGLDEFINRLWSGRKGRSVFLQYTMNSVNCQGGMIICQIVEKSELRARSRKALTVAFARLVQIEVFCFEKSDAKTDFKSPLRGQN